MDFGRAVRRAIGGFVLMGALAGAAAAQPSCGGADLIARMKRDEPERHQRLVAEAKTVPFGDARFFRIQKGGAAPSYLFGTAHVSDRRALDWVEQIEPRIRASRSVAIENNDVNPSNPSPAAMFKFAAMMVAKPDELLETHMTAEEINRLGVVAAPRLSLSPAAVARLRPWILYITLAIPECEAERAKLGKVVDSTIAAHGEAKGLTVQSLETVEEMLTALITPPMTAQVDILRSALATYSMAEDLLETTLRLLDKGDMGLMTAFARDESIKTLKDPKSYDIFLEWLIDKRNETMFRNARPLVDKGGAFIAVGALHLPGRKGLAQMFKDAGYRVTPLKLRRAIPDER